MMTARHEQEAPPPGRPAGPAGPARAGGQLLTLVLDLAAPIALFYWLRSAGAGLLLALAAGAVPPALSTLAGIIIRRRPSGLGLSVLAMLLLSAGASLITGSPRFMLARDGWLTGAWAIWFFASLLASRPVTFTFARPLLEGRRVFDPGSRKWTAPAPRSWDELWERVPAFRRAWRVTTVIWGAATLADAVIRVVMAWTLPADVVPGLGGALWPVTFIVLQVVTNVYFYRCGLWLILLGKPPPERI